MKAWNASAAGLDLATVEATNLHAVSVLVAVAALARAESRGCHRWRDEPPAVAGQRARHALIRVHEGRPLTVGTVPIKEEVGV